MPDGGLPAVSERLWHDLGVVPDEREIALPLITSLANGIDEVDADLAAVTTNWRLARLSVIDRSVLRLGTAELRAGLTPPRVVIQEAIRLAERYGTAESVRFVNGVLDAVARRLGKF